MKLVVMYADCVIVFTKCVRMRKCSTCAVPFLVFFLLSLASTREFERLDNALKRLFPGAQVEVKNITLSPEQVRQINSMSGVKLNTRLVSWYVAKKNNAVVGYVYVDIHRVRTHPETVLYAISPEGRIVAVEVLAFKEPLEYMPSPEWLKGFEGKSLDKDQIRLRRDIPNITGATLTAKAITDNTRKVLAMWQVLFGERR